MGRRATKDKDTPVEDWAYPISKKWKVPDVLPRSMGCVAHSLSVMRMTLGYKTGLPEGVTVEHPTPTCDIPEIAKACFPDRHVMAILSNAEQCFCGDWWDHYLLAFAYRNKNDGVGHFVVGSPYTHPEQSLDLIIAVSIDRKW